MKQRIFDAAGGVVSTIMTNDLTKETTFAQYQDPTAILENNKMLRDMNDGYNPAKDLRRVATIPKTVLMQWLREAGIPITDYMRNTKHYATWLRAKIYDRDNSMFLTAPHFAGRKQPRIQGLDAVISEGRK